MLCPLPCSRKAFSRECRGFAFFLAPQARAQRSAFQVRIRVRAQPMLLSTGERSK